MHSTFTHSKWQNAESSGIHGWFKNGQAIGPLALFIGSLYILGAASLRRFAYS